MDNRANPDTSTENNCLVKQSVHNFPQICTSHLLSLIILISQHRNKVQGQASLYLSEIQSLDRRHYINKTPDTCGWTSLRLRSKDVTSTECSFTCSTAPTNSSSSFSTVGVKFVKCPNYYNIFEGSTKNILCDRGIRKWNKTATVTIQAKPSWSY